jgi:hypothetical protein
MDKEMGALAVKSAATTAGGYALAFGLTGWAVAAAILGAVASLHFEQPAEGSRVWRVALQVFSLALLAALLGSALPQIPGCSAADAVPVAVRCGLLAIFANPISNWIRSFIARKSQGG